MSAVNGLRVATHAVRVQRSRFRMLNFARRIYLHILDALLSFVCEFTHFELPYDVETLGWFFLAVLFSLVASFLKCCDYNYWCLT